VLTEAKTATILENYETRRIEGRGRWGHGWGPTRNHNDSAVGKVVVMSNTANKINHAIGARRTRGRRHH